MRKTLKNLRSMETHSPGMNDDSVMFCGVRISYL